MGKVAGIRGAVSVKENNREEILSSTRQLLREMVEANSIGIEDIASVIFTATTDLDAAFPAEAAREMGWTAAALLDAVEIPVPGSMPRVVRVLILVNVTEDFNPRHVYLGNCKNLRPDLSETE
ncbi:MAG: chorismate mutase [Bacillota bacterium]